MLLRVLAVLLALATSAAAVQSWRLHKLQLGQAHAIAQAASQAVTDERQARAEEKRLKAKVQESATHDRTIDAPARRAAAERLRLAAGELLDAASASSGPATGDPTDPGGSAPAAGPGLVQADLLGGCGSRLAAVATWALETSAAGRVCERAWDAMTEERSAPLPGASESATASH